MSILTIFILLFVLLGAAASPMAVAFLSKLFSEDRGERLSQWAIRTGLTSVYRPVITFNAGNELTLKRRSYDEKHDADYLSFGNPLNKVKRYLHDPQDRFHPMYGVPFAFVDELFGVVIDPRDVDLGRSIRKAKANSRYTSRVEEGGRLHESVRAVFERPRGRIGVRLPDVGALVGGSFDAQIVDRIREYYQESQAPQTSTTALRQLLVPLGSFVLVVLLGMFVAGQANTGGGGGSSVPTNGTTLDYGMILLLAVGGLRAVNWRDLFVGLLAIAAAAGIGAGLLLAFPVILPIAGIPLPLGAWAIVALAIGFVIPPFVAIWLGRSLGPFGMLLGKLYIIIGLLQFDRPVIDFDNGRYRIVEYDPDEFEVEPRWYRFAMTRIGVSFLNDERNWPDGTTLERDTVETIADGGTPEFAPTDHVVTDDIQVGNIKGFVPEKQELAEDATYVRTDRTTGWLLEAGQDRRLMIAALQAAKEDFGGGRKPVGDKWILGATLVTIAMGAVFDWVVFF